MSPSTPYVFKPSEHCSGSGAHSHQPEPFLPSTIPERAVPVAQRNEAPSPTVYKLFHGSFANSQNMVFNGCTFIDHSASTVFRPRNSSDQSASPPPLSGCMTAIMYAGVIAVAMICGCTAYHLAVAPSRAAFLALKG